MHTLDTPLSDDEQAALADLLLARFGDDDDGHSEDRDEGILALDELDGFFTAIVSGPEPVLLSEWLPAVWGDFPPDWPTIADAQHAMNLLARLQNMIANELMVAPDEFEPLFSEQEVDGQTIVIVDEWCEGYLRGVRLAGDAWELEHPTVTALLQPLRAFCEESEWYGHEASDTEADALRHCIVPNVRALHAYWLNQSAPRPPLRREGPRTGRNDPCPCGSGRKYKQCCLQ